MLVTQREFYSIVSRFDKPGFYGLDTETFGLSFGEALFSIIIADETDGYYFNFLDQPDHKGQYPDPEAVLPREWIKFMQPIFDHKASLWFIHNAKFDLHKLKLEGVDIWGAVHCTEVTERIIRNDFLDYSLDACAKRRGWAKDDRVMEYIMKNKLYTQVPIPGKKARDKRMRFDLVPLEILVEYGIHDAKLHRALGMSQIRSLGVGDADSL